MKPIRSDSFIYLDERTLPRNKTIPYRVRFELNQSNLQTIIDARNNNRSLSFSTKNLTNLRYYALLSYTCQRSPLVFITNYSRDREKIAILKSTISAEGKICQQIRRDATINPQLFGYLINSHHWLIFQILTQLSLKSPKFFKWLLLVIFLLAAVAILLTIFYLLHISNILKTLLAIFSLVLLLAIAALFKNKLSAWILDRLLYGFLTTRFSTRKIGIQLLNLLSNK
ncbi:hypothetical protein [Myxosarcina sp. GI1(2024)]